MGPTRIHHILAEHGAVALPGIFDTLSARLAQQAGFPTGFVSGYGVAATLIGQPDVGLLTQTEMAQRARQIVASVEMPVLVDADTGYGNPLNVHRTVNEWIAAGAAGCLLEDQVWPKRCGHMQGKQVIERGEYIEKIRAAVDARADRDFFIIARTDALATDGMDEAIARVEAAREAGADGSFVEAPTSLEQLTEIGRRSPGPNLANMIVGGKTPVLPKQQLAELGFQLIVYPLAGLHAAAAAMKAVFETLVRDGTTLGDTTPIIDFEQFNQLIGVERARALARRFGAG